MATRPRTRLGPGANDATLTALTGPFLLPDTMDIRRTVLWMIFAFSLLLLWNNWQIHNGKASLFGGPPPASSASQNDATKTSDASAQNGSIPTAQASTPAGSSATPPTVPTSTSPRSQDVTVSTDLMQLTFDTRGAQIVRAELLKYNDIERPNQHMVLLDDSRSQTYLVQSGLVGGADGQPFPNHETPFQLVSAQNTLVGDSLQVVFQAESGGVKLVKTFTLHRDSYAIDVSQQVINAGSAPVTPSLYLQIERDGNNPPDTSSFYHTFTGMALYTDQEKFQKATFSDVEKGKASYVKQADHGWIAVVQHYFATAWVPAEGAVRNNDMVSLGNNLYAIRSIEPLGSLAAGATKTVNAKLWVGPQDQKAMASTAQGLDLVVDYGWLTIIAKPLFRLMTWLHSLLGNWGWTIVVLTLLIKAVFYPLAATSYRSMARMKQVAPRLQALKERFGDDKQKLNAAMMEMYRTEKINPLGGCLPMVVQIPVFISLYWVLLGSVEMRGAPWILWIHDLSVRDPFFVLPVLMMGTMFLQMRLNPKPPDPVQAKVMMVMPLVFGGVMFFFPAGLVLYWCVNNTVSILQQYYITRSIRNATVAAAKK